MSDGYITDWPVSERFPHYTRANAGEVMGDPVSPFGWAYGWDGAMVLGMRDGWIRGGTHERELALPGVVSATGATGSIPEGVAIQVNGDTGVVTIVESGR